MSESKEFYQWLSDSQYALASPQTKSCMWAAWQAARSGDEVATSCAYCGGAEKIAGGEPIGFTTKLHIENLRSGRESIQGVFLTQSDRHSEPLYTHPPAKVPEWKSLHKLVDDYIEGYEFRGDDGDYHPTDQERFLIEDCVAGIMHQLQEAITAATNPPAKVPERLLELAEEAITDAAAEAQEGGTYEPVEWAKLVVSMARPNPPTQEGE